MEGKFVSPNEMFEKGKEMMLSGREPESREDWMMMFNFFAKNIGKGLEESACLLMGKIWDCGLSENDIMGIARFQMELKE